MSRHTRSRRRQSFNIPGHAHELTFSVYRRYQFLRAERCCQWLAEAIEGARRKQSFWLWAFVFMPEHVHLILYPFAPKYDMARILESIKQPVGSRAIEFLDESQSPWLARLTRKRGQRTERLFWQSGGGYDRNITAARTLLRIIDYVHENPFRRRLVSEERDWHWSNMRHYTGGDSPIQIDAIPPEWLDTSA